MDHLFTWCFAYIAQQTTKKLFCRLPSENPAWSRFSLTSSLVNFVSSKFLLLYIKFSLVEKKKQAIFAYLFAAVIIRATKTGDCGQNLAFPRLERKSRLS